MCVHVITTGVSVCVCVSVCVAQLSPLEVNWIRGGEQRAANSAHASRTVSLGDDEWKHWICVRVLSHALIYCHCRGSECVRAR